MGDAPGGNPGSRKDPPMPAPAPTHSNSSTGDAASSTIDLDSTGDFHKTQLLGISWSPNEHPANAGVAAEEPPDHQESGSRTHEATTADDARGQAAELDALWRQASDAPTSTDSSVSDSSPVDDTTSTDSAVCMQCEFNPGTEGPLGQFCRKCAVELSESGIQIYRRV